MSYAPILDLGYIEQDLRYSQGDARGISITYTDKVSGLPKDLTDYVFTAGIISPAISFTTDNSNPTTGIMTINISSANTSTLVKGGKYRWYVTYVYSGVTRKNIEGDFILV